MINEMHLIGRVKDVHKLDYATFITVTTEVSRRPEHHQVTVFNEVPCPELEPGDLVEVIGPLVYVAHNKTGVINARIQALDINLVKLPNL